MRDRAAPTAAIAAVLVVLVATRLTHLSNGPLDFDEGVYWLSMRSMRAGNPLFTAVYSSQPPAFLGLAEPPWNWLGGSIEAARAVMVAWAVLAVGAGAVLGWILGGRTIAVVTAVLLAVDPRMLDQSITLQADGPATALALLALAAAALAMTTQRSRWRAVAALAAGALLALGILTKLFDVGVAPVVVVVLLSGRRRWATLGCAGAGALATTAALLLPIIDAWPAMWTQMIGLHVSARNDYAGADLGFLGLFLQTEWPLVAVAVVGLVAGRRRHPRAWLVGLLWTAGAVAAFFATRPLFPHHLVLVVPGLAILGATGVAAVIAECRDRLHPRSRVVAASLSAVAATVACGVVLQNALAAETAATNPALVARLQALIPASALLISDDQYDQAAAGRDAPPQLVDTSGVRLRGGGVTAATLEAALLRDPRVCGVLFATGRLSGVPGFGAWVAVEYPQRTSLPGGPVLYSQSTCRP